MKILEILSALILAAPLVYAQTESKGGVLMSAGEDSFHATLTLATRIVDEQYCTNNRVRYSLLFKFKNIGQQTVILDRFRPIVTRYMVSANEKAATKRKYESVVRIFFGLDTPSVSWDPHLDEARFIILKTGESHEVEDGFSMSIEDEEGKPLRPGTHMLQVVAMTWHHPRASNIEWREKWRNKGYLWSDSLLSAPMPFVILKRPPVSDCR